jgi:hypothetical protein
VELSSPSLDQAEQFAPLPKAAPFESLVCLSRNIGNEQYTVKTALLTQGGHCAAV